MIPLLHLGQLNAQFQTEIDAAVLRVARSGHYILAAEVEAFENEWAQYCGVKHCVGTGNALDALRLILMAHGIGRGAEVIVPANTYIATWLAVTLAGATPVPVEPLAGTYNIDPNAIAAAVTPRTEAIMAVHLYGNPADMYWLREVADRHNLALFADAAQAHGAEYYGDKVGRLCDAEAFSFYPSKNLGALGDGGCVTLNNGMIAARIRRLRNYGGVGRLDHTVRGINSRLDEIQAAVLRVKLPHLDRMNNDRRARAGIYSRDLYGDVGIPPMDSGACWHQYVIRVQNRAEVIERLAQNGVDAHVHYPVPPHLEPAYADMGHSRGDFPIAEQLADEVLSLPIGNDVDVVSIAQKVLSSLQGAE